MFTQVYPVAADSCPNFLSLRQISPPFTSHFCFARFSLKPEKKKICYLKYPCGSLKNKSLVYVSSKPTEESAEDIATAASSQSSPKTMLEGDTG